VVTVAMAMAVPADKKGAAGTRVQVAEESVSKTIRQQTNSPVNRMTMTAKSGLLVHSVKEIPQSTQNAECGRLQVSLESSLRPGVFPFMAAADSLCRGHVLRVHLKPLQCPRCAKFRAGDDGQVEKHLRDTNCEKPTTFIPVDESTVQKGKDLKKGSKKTVTWQQVYMVLFNCQQHEVPSPCKSS